MKIIKLNLSLATKLKIKFYTFIKNIKIKILLINHKFCLPFLYLIFLNNLLSNFFNLFFGFIWVLRAYFLILFI